MSEERTYPQDLEAEMSVLGAMLINPNAIPVAGELLAADDFYRTSHGAIFRSIAALYEKGIEVDVITVGAELERQGELERAGGRDYLHTLAEFVPAAANALHYAETVRDMSARRQLMTAGYEIAELGLVGAGDAGALLDTAERRIYGLADRDRGRGLVDAQDSLRALMESLPERQAGRRVRRVRCGFENIDDCTGGLGRGELCIVGARPSVGKTSLAACIALHVACNEGRVVFFSLEMDVDAVTERLVQAHCSVGSDELRRGRLDERQRGGVEDLLRRTAGGRLRIDSTATATPLHVRHVARRASTQGQLALVIVDYLQLLHSARRAENRQQEVAEISHSLKALALELDCPVLALSQLNRQLEGRSQEGRPRLSDLRDSGAIEQDADVVVFLHTTPEQHKAALQGQLTIEVEIEVAKNRNGRIGSGALIFERRYTRFRDKLP